MKLKKLSNLTEPVNQRVLVTAIQSNDQVALKSIYTLNYPKVEAYILKNSGSKEQAKDIYQDAFVAVWSNIKSGKFEVRSESSINGYLYTISKNKWLDYLRSKHYKKTTNLPNQEFNNHSDVNIDEKDDDILKEKRLENVMQAFKGLASGCKTLLTKFYFEKKSMETIAEELNLDPASTRNKKYRCMQKLREIALKN